MKLRQEGKFRFLGITEAFIPDPRHVMLRSALDDDWWDVVMVGFNMLNQMARTEVFPKTPYSQTKTRGICPYKCMAAQANAATPI